MLKAIHLFNQSVENRSCQLSVINCYQQKGYKFDTEVVVTDFIDAKNRTGLVHNRLAAEIEQFLLICDIILSAETEQSLRDLT